MVSKKYFSPPPKVESAIILLNVQMSADIIRINADKYYTFIKKAFKQPRKTLINNLVSAGYRKEEALKMMTQAGLELKDRPSALSRQTVIEHFRCS
jgi:16S rRNA A1518/A1519 N6-dimethyltransferase RsmA/KsgA/DIM1 with predicted DNA glycosylase/AP lyase activity